jgi:hypothetical protein
VLLGAEPPVPSGSEGADDDTDVDPASAGDAVDESEQPALADPQEPPAVGPAVPVSAHDDAEINPESEGGGGDHGPPADPPAGGGSDGTEEPPEADSPEPPVIRIKRRQGRSFLFPGAEAEALLIEGGSDPESVREWIAWAPFALGYERWHRTAQLRCLAAARGPFKRRRPVKVSEDVAGYEPEIEELERALERLAGAKEAGRAQTLIHWCQGALDEVETGELINPDSTRSLRAALEKALIETVESRSPHPAAECGRRWRRLLRRAMR